MEKFNYKGYQVLLDMDDDKFYWLHYTPNLPKDIDASHNKVRNSVEWEKTAKFGIDKAVEQYEDGYYLFDQHGAKVGGPVKSVNELTHKPKHRLLQFKNKTWNPVVSEGFKSFLTKSI